MENLVVRSIPARRRACVSSLAEPSTLDKTRYTGKQEDEVNSCRGDLAAVTMASENA